MDQALIQNLMFYGVLVGTMLVAIVIIGLAVWKASFNIPVLVFETRSNNNIRIKKTNARYFEDEDGIPKYWIFSWNFLANKVYIKPTDGRNIFQLKKRDMLMVDKDENGNYSYIKYNRDDKAFENVPASVHYWASLTRKERAMVHKTGFNWALMGAYGLVFFGMVICLIMIIFVLDWAGSIKCAGGSVSGGSIPLVDKLT